ncbi:hypothetical protein LRS13_01670 [Svornostia abyssi]|uniref:Antitoxin n=1 Tax=Svornostia abyssi TaxID=2898438 RepID=A0ABY5PI29_9ACTN|nr:hypothetical protein LRS13_01670 [Parviterribacteraceae bacterium J379]
MTKPVGVREAEAQLPALLERVAAGEVIVIADRGEALAMLTPVPPGTRTFGVDAGVFTVPEDFDAPLPGGDGPG